ncbi:MAG: MOSC domain-containing protein [bacterium]|nr:MOSC domain-containing protein [bacterium]
MADNKQDPIELTKIIRYPIKGLSPETLRSVELAAGATLPYDRAYAIENGKSRFDPANPKYLPKINFLMLMRHERMAKLKTSFDDRSRELTIELDGKQVSSGVLYTSEGRRAIEDFVTDYMTKELNGSPKIVHARDHSFSDVSSKCLHVINLNSVRQLEKLFGHAVDPLRFRANLIVDGPDAFSELDWVGKTLSCDEIMLKIFKRTQRCPATNVNPQNGVRDMTIPDLLFEHFGHHDFGVYARVESGGALIKGAKFHLS